MLAAWQEHDGIHKLIGVVDSKDSWSMARDIISSDNLNLPEEDRKNGKKEDLDQIVQ